jgi:tetratricopeptide (TPR) repeat protein
MNNLAVAYEKTGRLDDALPVYQESFKFSKAKLGPDHPDTLTTMHNFATAYGDAGRSKEALLLLDELLKLQKSKLGLENPRTLETMGDLASAYQKAGRSADVERLFNDVLTPAFTSKPQSSGVLQARANFFARQARWKEAAADLSRALELSPDNHEVWHTLAPVLVQEGRLDLYREHCRKSLERFGNTTDPTTAERIAKDCLILPDSGADLVTVAKMTHTALTGKNYPWDRAWCRMLKGWADYRQGDFTSAAEWERKVLTPLTHDEPARNVEACLVQAMAYHQLNQPAKARAALAQGSQWAKPTLQKLEDGGLGHDWGDWIIAQALLREARALIEGQPVTARDAGK